MRHSLPLLNPSYKSIWRLTELLHGLSPMLAPVSPSSSHTAEWHVPKRNIGIPLSRDHTGNRTARRQLGVLRRASSHG